MPFPLSCGDLMLVLLHNYEIFDYLDVGEEDYLTVLRNAKERVSFAYKHEPIDTAILYSLVKTNYEKSPGKSPYVKVDRTR